MISLIVAPYRLPLSTPLALGILKSVIPKMETKCIDLSLKFQEKYIELFREKLKSVALKELDLDKYMMSIGSKQYAMDESIPKWLFADYPLTLLNNSSNSPVDRKLKNLFDEMANEILKEDPQIACFSTTIFSLGTNLNLAKRVHEAGVKTAFGGPAVLFPWRQLVKEYDFIDAIGVGEGELIFRDMVDSLLSDGKKRVWISEKIVSMDKIPFPNYEDLDIKKYKTLMIETQRGCINRCAFCSIRKMVSSGFYRQKSAERVQEEVRHVKKYGNRFSFADNITNSSKRRVKKLSERLEREEIEWDAQFFPRMGKEDVSNIKKAGCVSAHLGCESFSDNLLKKMNKPLDAQTIVKTLKNLHEKHIFVYAGFIFRFPGETLKDIIVTLTRMLKYQKYVNLFGFSFYKLTWASPVHLAPEKYNVTIHPSSGWSSLHGLVPYRENKCFKPIEDAIGVPLIKFVRDSLPTIGGFYYVTK